MRNIGCNSHFKAKQFVRYNKTDRQIGNGRITDENEESGNHMQLL